MNQESDVKPGALRKVHDRRTKLANLNCIYCGKGFGPDCGPTKEHVIARRFVPHVSFNDNWFLIANACRECNDSKAKLENDISAVTMQPDAFGRSPSEDDSYKDQAQRKAKGAISSRTRRPVAESEEKLTVTGMLGAGASWTAGLRSAPQLDRDKAFQLARYHLAGFFFFITYDDARRRGGFWPGGFYPVSVVQKSDWGNAQIIGFAKRVSGWLPRLHLDGADGYFKAVIRREHDSELWSWALEWNRSYRLFGFFGDYDAAVQVADDLPKLQMKVAERGVDPVRGRFETRYREEVPLGDGEDELFAVDVPTNEAQQAGGADT